MSKYDFLVVGAGLAGIVSAQQLAQKGYSILIIDKRDHLGGNAYDVYDENGILIHPYGPHIFHTNDRLVFKYLSQFTEWRFYEHRVLANVDGELYPMPINRTTINKLYGYDFSEKEIDEYLKSVRVLRDPLKNSEDVVLANVGYDLCDKFFRNYTYKQWGIGLSELSPSVASRIPTRTNNDDRYFTDIYQFMPAEGYSEMFERMLSNRLIDVQLFTSYESIKSFGEWINIIYTGSLDAYYDFCYGYLPYRSLKFEFEYIEKAERYQKVGTVNYPNDHSYTRITEFKHLTGQKCLGTTIMREYPASDGDPFYPMPLSVKQSVAESYYEMAKKAKNVYFVGRLAQYRYFNMDQVVKEALDLINKI